jgi:hypothetical protein
MSISENEKLNNNRKRQTSNFEPHKKNKYA